MHLRGLDPHLAPCRQGTGTRLLFDHAGFDLDKPDHRFAFDNMGPGWRYEVLPRPAALVEHTP